MRRLLRIFVIAIVIGAFALTPAMAHAAGAPMPQPASSKSSIIVYPELPPASQPSRSCIVIGDSLTGRGALTKYLKASAEADSAKLRLTGTRGSDFNRHEGRSGWRMYDYINRQSSSGITNAFYNPTARKFDFSYYMRVNGYLTPGYVLIEMGINDTFLYYSDNSLNAEIKNILSRYEAMITSIRAYQSTIKIGILVTIPPTSIESTFRADYGTRQTLSRYQRNNTLWVAALKNRFRGRESSNIYLVPTDTGIDRAHIVGVHPDDTAYRQMAAVVWAWMKGH